MLDRVTLPADSRALSVDELKQLADDVRREMIDAVSVTGGHLGAGLGVVELTVALHHVFETQLFFQLKSQLVFVHAFKSGHVKPTYYLAFTTAPLDLKIRTFVPSSNNL